MVTLGIHSYRRIDSEGHTSVEEKASATVSPPMDMAWALAEAVPSGSLDTDEAVLSAPALKDWARMRDVSGPAEGSSSYLHCNNYSTTPSATLWLHEAWFFNRLECNKKAVPLSVFVTCSICLNTVVLSCNQLYSVLRIVMLHTNLPICTLLELTISLWQACGRN